MTIDLARLRAYWNKRSDSFAPEDISWLKEHAYEAADEIERLRTALSEVTQRAERAEQDAAAVRALMNLHNLGGWTDAEAPMKAGRWALALVTDWVDTDRYDMREYVAARATLGFPALNGELPLPEAPK